MITIKNFSGGRSALASTASSLSLCVSSLSLRASSLSLCVGLGNLGQCSVSICERSVSVYECSVPQASFHVERTTEYRGNANAISFTSNKSFGYLPTHISEPKSYFSVEILSFLGCRAVL